MTMTYDGTNGITFPDSSLQKTAGYSPFRNRIINGDMRIDQRNSGASVTPANGQTYLVDRFCVFNSVTSKYTAQRSTAAPAGFTNSLLITSSSAYTVGTNEIFMLQQRVEGFNMADLGWGTASASPVTLSFWVRSSVTGTFGGVIENGGTTRNYPFTYTINSANTWEQKTITVAGDTTGTWTTDNSTGMYVIWGLGVGSTYSGTAGSWAAGEKYSATGATSLLATNGATFYITGVQLEKGSVATPFEYRPYGQELQLCQRYYENHYCDASGQPVLSGSGAGANAWFWHFKQEKRAQATITKVNGTWNVSPSLYGGISSGQAYSASAFYLTATAGQVALSASAEL